MAEPTCEQCGAPFLQTHGGRGRPQRFCSPTCKNRAGYLRKKADGRYAARVERKRVEYAARHPRGGSRRSRRPTPVACVDCGTPVSAERYYRCGPCSRAELRQFLDQTGRSQSETRRASWTKRNRLDNAAPGPYSRKRRHELRAKWQRQGRRCVYCLTGPVEQVDHIIPLTRGGTNYEGNLVPACSQCNHDKWDNLLSAWRYGIAVKRAPVTWVSLESKARRSKPKPRWTEPVPLFASVCVCGEAIAGRAEFCSARCAARTRYRRMAGIPDDLPTYHQNRGKETRRARTQAGPPLRQAG